MMINKKSQPSLVKITLIIILGLAAIAIVYLFTPELQRPEPIGELKKDGWNQERLYCNGHIVTGWVYTFAYEIPQEELDEICEMELKNIERRLKK